MRRPRKAGPSGAGPSAGRGPSADKEVLRWCDAVVSQVSALEPEMTARSDGELRGLTGSFRARLACGEELDALLTEAFAAAREASSRALGQRPFDVQVMGAAVLHRGLIAELLAGEGKTLAGTLAAYLNALPGAGVHILTANEYLARRDWEWMTPVFRFLGLETGLLDVARAEPDARAVAYAADVTYGLWSEFGFDYLRDNMAWSATERVQRDLRYGLVDDADLVLIDEMRTPLFISGPGSQPDSRISDCARIVAGMTPSVHYEADGRARIVTPTNEGARYLEAALGVEDQDGQAGQLLLRQILDALAARDFYHRDREYVVDGGAIVPIDAGSGRPNAGRRFGDGIHQAIEAKESLRISAGNQTLARTTMRDYLSLYERMAGMTGTAVADLGKYGRFYHRDVVPIPANRPMIRVDHPDVFFPGRQAKLRALAGDAAGRHAVGQPVLIGVASIEERTEISRLLTARGIDHQVLTALNHESEAPAMAQAALAGALTVVAPTAGRGVDIILGGAEGAERDAVRDAGGLCVLGSERSADRRLESHLRGRAGRQGEPGESKFYLSFDDDLVKATVSPRVRSRATRATPSTGAAFHKLSAEIDSAQGDHALRQTTRLAELAEYDTVLTGQQHEIYAERRQVLDRPDDAGWIREVIDEVVRERVARSVTAHLSGSQLHAALGELYPTSLKPSQLETRGAVGSLPDLVAADAQGSYALREVTLGRPVLRDVERRVLLDVTDAAWHDHLREMDALRDGIGLRATVGQSPLDEYRREAAALFAQVRQQIKARVVANLFYLKIELIDPGVLLAAAVLVRACKNCLVSGSGE